MHHKHWSYKASHDDNNTITVITKICNQWITTKNRQNIIKIVQIKVIMSTWSEKTLRKSYFMGMHNSQNVNY